MSRDPQASALAIDGGPPVRSDSMPPRLLFAAEEKAAVVALFDQAMAGRHEALGYNGPQEEGYGREFAEMLGGGFADGVNSGTSAVYVALRALDLPAFSEVIVPPITDNGGVMPVPLTNCIPVPADSAPGSFNTDAERIEARLTERTSAIIVAHIGGTPADLDPILELARARDLPVIEDCAQAHGASYRGQPVGSLGDLAAFSTMSGKHHATAGQGGVVFTRSEEIYWRVRRCADRGKPFGLTDGPNDNVVASLNLNMDELHAAIGRVQLTKLPRMLAQRRRVAVAVEEGCRASLQSVALIGDPPECEAAYWFLQFCLDCERLSVTKTAFVEALGAEGLPASATYLVVPTRMTWGRDRTVFGTPGLPWTDPLYEGDPDRDYPLPNVEQADAQSFRVFFHEGWTEREVEDLLAALRKVERAYLR